MSAVTFWDYILEALVLPSDLNDDSNATRNLVGEALSFLLSGVTNALPSSSPLAIVLSTSSLGCIIGGSGQTVFTQNRLCDTCPADAITIIPNFSGSTRTDLIAISYSPTATNPQPRPTPTGTETVSQSEESIAYVYYPSTTVPPAGFVAFATIAVPPGATLSSQCTVTYLFQTVAQLLESVLGGIVSSVNGTNGPISLQNGTEITVTALGGGSFSINFTGNTNPVASVGGVVGGAVAVEQGTAIGVTVAGNAITISNRGVQSLNGLSNAALSIGSPDSSLAFGTSGTEITVEWSPQYRTFGGEGNTIGSGVLTVTVPYQIVAAVGTIGQNFGGTNQFVVFVDQNASNFAAGVVAFYGLAFGTSPAVIGAGLGIFYSITTNNTPA